MQRSLGDGVHPVARLGDFAGSLATWQSPRMLTELAHGRGPSAPSGSAVGIVDATPGPPGVAELPVAGVPLSPLTTSTLPGSATAPVQREVRFDQPAGLVVQRALSAASESGSGAESAGRLLGSPAVVQRSEGPSSGAAGLSPVAASALPAPEASVGSAAVGVPPAGSSASSSSASSSGPSSTGPTAGDPTVGDTGSSAPDSVAEAVDGPPVAPRSVADPDPGRPVLGATPLPRTLAEPPAMLQRSVDAPGRPLSQLPVLVDATPVRSFVTAPPPPTARPALPVVPAGDGVVQRAVGSMTDRPTSTGAGSSVADGAAPVTTSGDAHDGPGPAGTPAAATAASAAEVAHTGSSPSGTPSLPDAPERAPLLADAPVLEVPGEVTSVTDAEAPTVSRLATGPVAPAGPAAPRRLGLGAPLPTPPGPVVQRSPEAGPRRLGLGAPLTRPPQQRVPDPPDTGPVVQMLPAGGPDNPPRSRRAEHRRSGGVCFYGGCRCGAPGRPADVDRHTAGRRAHRGPRAGGSPLRASL